MNLTLKKVPAGLHRRLKLQAKRNRRSLNAEALCVLEDSLPSPAENVDAIIARLEQINKRHKGPRLTHAKVRAAIEEGRE
jgi:plasmid stability protein